MDIKSYFCGMKDPRLSCKSLHKLEDIVFISVACVLCGGESWYDMELFGKQKYDWLSRHLELPNGIPSHDTFNRFFSALDPAEFERCFFNWTSSLRTDVLGEIISVDGKTMRRAHDNGSKSSIHLVSAWADTNDLVLGQVKTGIKSNEITAIPELLSALLLEGCIVTIDAMGCQREIAGMIIEKRAGYVLAVKGNQGELLRGIRDSFRFSTALEFDEETDMGHGRVESRKCRILSDLSMIDRRERWAGLKSIVEIESTRYTKADQKQQTEVRYYISSLSDAQLINRAVRKHWGVENKLHWVLDMTFQEDYCRTRTKYAAQNFAMLSKICLNILKKSDMKASIKGKRKAAGWNDNYLEDLLKV